MFSFGLLFFVFTSRRCRENREEKDCDLRDMVDRGKCLSEKAQRQKKPKNIPEYSRTERKSVGFLCIESDGEAVREKAEGRV